MFPPYVDWHNVKWKSRRPLMDFPIQSVICEPKDSVVVKSGDMVDLYGYAIAGGGRGIERIEISITNGKSWLEALPLPKLQIDVVKSDAHHPQWAWTLWELKFVEVETPCTVLVKATDSAGNAQPADVDEIWNLRGVLNNSWHSIRINAPCPPEDDPPAPAGPDWAKNAAENAKRQCKSPEDHAHDWPPPNVLDSF